MAANGNVKLPAPDRLADAIKRDLQTAVKLLELLGREFESLNQRDEQIILQVIAEKQRLMTALEQGSKARTQLLVQLGRIKQPGGDAEESQAAWQQLLEDVDATTLPELWNDFVSTLNDCQRQNEINGKIIARGQRTLRQLMTLVRGQTVETPRLYNSTGSAHKQNASHNFIKV